MEFKESHNMKYCTKWKTKRARSGMYIPVEKECSFHYGKNNAEMKMFRLQIKVKWSCLCKHCTVSNLPQSKASVDISLIQNIKPEDIKHKHWEALNFDWQLLWCRICKGTQRRIAPVHVKLNNVHRSLDIRHQCT